MSEKPTKEEIDIFCDSFNKLANFEAEQRMIRGYGCFSMDDVTKIQPVCAKVLAWLGSPKQMGALEHMARLKSAWKGGGRRALIDAYEKIVAADTL